jgi:hypothetical protein
VAYWKNEALESSRPAVQSWGEFASKVKSIRPADLQEVLIKLRTDVMDALGKVSGKVYKQETLDRDRKEVADAFGALEASSFEKEAKSTLAGWRDLAQQVGGAGAARDQLLRDYALGRVKDSYFAAYRSEAGKGVKYYNDLQVQGLRLLIKETAGEIGAASETLRRSKGVPLCAGDVPDLSPDQVRAARAAAVKLEGSGAAAGDQPAPNRNADLDDELRPLLQDLSGTNLVARSRETQVWFGKLKTMLGPLADGKPVRITKVTVAVDGLATPRKGGAGSDAGGSFTYGALFVGGQRRGTAFRLDSPTPDDKAREMTSEYPADFGRQVEIRLYKKDPGVGDLDKPDGRIVLPSQWGIVGEALRNADDTGTGKAGWRVLLTGQGGYYLWVDATLDPELPPKDSWPSAAGWP